MAAPDPPGGIPTNNTAAVTQGSGTEAAPATKAATAASTPQQGAWKGGPPPSSNLQAFLTAQQIVQGHQPGRLLQVIQHDEALPPSSALSIRKSALAMLQPASQVPTTTLRLTLSSSDHQNLSRTQLENAILAHFNKGRSAFPMLAGPIPTEYEQYAPLATGIKLTVLRPNATRPMAHAYDVSFASEDALRGALKQGPFMFGGKMVELESAVEVMGGLVEFRIVLPNLALGAAHVSDMFRRAFPDSSPTIHHIHRILYTDPNIAGGLPVYKGEVYIYASDSERWDDLSGAELAARLPVALTIPDPAGDILVPLRTSYEQEWCYKCKFGGHQAAKCPRFPSAPRAPPPPARKPTHVPQAAPLPPPKTPAAGRTIGNSAVFRTPKQTNKGKERSSANALPVGMNSKNLFGVLGVEGDDDEEEGEVVEKPVEQVEKEVQGEGDLVSPNTNADEQIEREDAPTPTPAPRVKIPLAKDSKRSPPRTRSQSLSALVDEEGYLGTPTQPDSDEEEPATQ